jgi:hypothetical protein
MRNLHRAPRLGRSTSTITRAVVYKVFISHNTLDQEWVELMRSDLAAAGIDAYLSEHDIQPGKDLSEKLQQAIRGSDAFVVLMSQHSAPSSYVHQEVGYALAIGRRVIPIVEKGTPANALAMLQKVEYIPIDFSEPKPAMQSLSAYLTQRKKEQQDRDLAIALVIIGVVIILAANSGGGTA